MSASNWLRHGVSVRIPRRNHEAFVDSYSMTAAVTENCETKTAVIWTNRKNKDANSLFIEFMYENWIKSNDDVEEIICSVRSIINGSLGNSVLHLMPKELLMEWGVISNPWSLSKGKDWIIVVQNSADFATAAKKLARKTSVFHFLSGRSCVVQEQERSDFCWNQTSTWDFQSACDESVG